MKATYIEYGDTHCFSDTLLSYISKDARLKPFITDWPDLENFTPLIEAEKPLNREVLYDVLSAQYAEADYQNAEAKLVLENIEQLKSPDTFTVTTGHQLNIFTGPLYFIYKIITAINLCKELKAAYPQKNFVPVYWMASEDHDFEEINHVKLHGAKYTWDITAAGATGRIDPKSVEPVLSAYIKALGVNENTERLSALLRKAYLEQNSLAGATRYLVHNLFSHLGLVVLDADSPKLKAQFAGIIKQDLLEQASYRSINQTSEELSHLGFKTQVHAREINFFYLKDQLRERIILDGEHWQVLNSDIRFNREELLSEIDAHPERFSPNVVMRPLYQELILPNLAYVGGGAEIVYWLQLKRNFEQYGIGFPMLILRNSALVTDSNFSNKLYKLKLDHPAIFKNIEVLKKQWVLSHSEHNLHLDAERQQFERVFEQLRQRVSPIDRTLAPSTSAIEARLKKALARLETKLIKAEKRNHQDALTQVEKLKAHYFPGGGLQERVNNLGELYAAHGSEFIDALLEVFKPLNSKFTILEI